MKNGKKYYRGHESCRQPFVRLLIAKSDKDPDAMMIDVTPVDLSDNGCCPTCGHTKDARPEP